MSEPIQCIKICPGTAAGMHYGVETGDGEFEGEVGCSTTLLLFSPSGRAHSVLWLLLPLRCCGEISALRIATAAGRARAQGAQQVAAAQHPIRAVDALGAVLGDTHGGHVAEGPLPAGDDDARSPMLWTEVAKQPMPRASLPP